MDPAPLPPPPSTSRTTSAVVAVLGFAGLVIASVSLLDEDRSLWPGPTVAIVAIALALASTIAAAHVWVHLIGTGDPRRLARSVYVSQLAKYLPVGGLAQIAGQVAMTAAQGIARGRIAGASLATVWVMVSAGATLSAGLSLVHGVPLVVRIVAPLGLLVPLTGHRRFVGTLRGLAERVTRRDLANVALPSARSASAAFVLAATNLALYGALAAVLARAQDSSVSPIAVALAYIAAWVVGFVCIPVPSGIGVREAVLVALLPSVDPGVLLAASVGHRVAALTSEILLSGASLVRSRRAAPWIPPEAPG